MGEVNGEDGTVFQQERQSEPKWRGRSAWGALGGLDRGDFMDGKSMGWGLMVPKLGFDQLKFLGFKLGCSPVDAGKWQYWGAVTQSGTMVKSIQTACVFGFCPVNDLHVVSGPNIPKYTGHV